MEEPGADFSQGVADGMERRRREKRSRSPEERYEKAVTSDEVWGNVGRGRVLHHSGGEDHRECRQRVSLRSGSFRHERGHQPFD